MNLFKKVFNSNVLDKKNVLISGLIKLSIKLTSIINALKGTLDFMSSIFVKLMKNNNKKNLICLIEL